VDREKRLRRWIPIHLFFSLALFLTIEGVHKQIASKMKRRIYFETKKPVSSPLT
jgi:hypothetical protein